MLSMLPAELALADEYVYMINTGPEGPFTGSNYGETNEHTSQVR
jgi:hypothetical protein